MANATEEARAPGRPRRPGVGDAVIAATVELMTAHGYERTTIDEIARSSGVAKTTIYRRWRSKGELAIDALVRVLGEPPVASSASESALRDTISWLGARIRESKVRSLLAGLVTEAAWDAELRGQLRERIREPFVRRVVQDWRLVARDVDLVFDIVVGGLLHRLAMTGDITAEDTAAFTAAATGPLFGRRSSHRR